MSRLEELKNKLEQFSAGGLDSKKETAVSNIDRALDSVIEEAESGNPQRFLNKVKSVVAEIAIFANDVQQRKGLDIRSSDIISEIKDILDEINNSRL